MKDWTVTLSADYQEGGVVGLEDCGGGGVSLSSMA